jgi:hypothetical protein
MTFSGESERTIEAYLAALRKQLWDLTDEDARDIVDEIRTHILEKTSGDTAPETVQETLTALGTPVDLAGRYRTEELLERGRQARSASFVLRSLLRWTGLSVGAVLVFAVSIIGYGVGGGLFLLGIMKVMDHSTGVWGVFNQHNVSLGFQSPGPPSTPGAHELLGWWLLPIGLLFGPGLFLLTFRLDTWSIRRFWKPRTPAAD